LLFFLFRERLTLLSKLAFTFPGLFDEGVKVNQGIGGGFVSKSRTN
jgi:hypothetical protein